MKMSFYAWAGALSCVFLAGGGLQAQELMQPLSVRPVGFNYNNLSDESAVPPPAESVADHHQAEASPITPTPVGSGTVSGAPCGCSAAAPAVSCSSCAAPSCGVSCDSCGCGDGCGLGLCDCNLGEAWTLSRAIHGDCDHCISVGGWFSAGYHSESNGLFNDRPNEFALHQGWIYAEKAATCESPFGFRADFMYGIDAADTQAFGNPPGTWDFDNGWDNGAYGWALPQLYGEVALSDTWSVKAGHFYTLVGYEVVTAPDNFFYSHAMTMYNSEPFTHTGVLATGAINDTLTVYAGWTAGWDTGFDQFNDGSSWLGGFSLNLSDSAAFTYISTAGNLGARGEDAYSHSLVLDMNVSDNLNWVVQSDVLRVESTGEDNFGINQYLLYSVNDCLGLGARMEWWKADNITGYAPHNAVLPADGSFSYYAATFGANIRTHANLLFRPEVRVDWSPAADYDETYFGVDAIVTF